jgi:hypothetical protein
MSDQQSKDWSRKLFWPAICVLVLIKLWLSFTRYLNQDEFETLHQGWLIFSGAVQFRDFNSNHPPIAFTLVGLPNYLTSDPIVLVYLGRLLTFIASLISLALIYGISKSIFDERAARWAVIAYCMNVTFWEWSIEIRSDFAMIPLWLAGVYLFVSQPKSPSNTRALLIGVFLALAFWANQKVVFHAVPLGLFMLLGGVHKSWKLQHTAIALVGSLICCAGFIAHAHFTGNLPHMFQHNFEGAWTLVLSSDYAKFRNRTILHALKYDPVFVVAGLLAATWAIGTRRTRLTVFAGISTFWMIITLFLTPGPFQYYLTSVFPFFAVVIGGWAAHLETKLAEIRPPAQVRTRVALALAVFAACPMIRFAKLLTPTIGYQLQVVRLIHQITDDNTSVFDGAGTQLNRPDAYPFHWVLWKGELERYAAGADERGEDNVSDSMPRIFPLLVENKCELVVDTYRVARLPKEDQTLLFANFVTWWGPIRVPGFDSINSVGREPIEFELMHAGEYESEQANLIIDGKPWVSGGPLTAGFHTIALAKEEPQRVRLRRITKAEHLKPTDGSIEPGRFLGFYGYHY